MRVFLIGASGDMPSPRTILFAMSYVGFVLIVWAFGTLIRCRPPHGRDGSVFYPSGRWELNPLAVTLLASAPSVVVFKLSLTIGAAIVFLVARSYRLAQVGCWWVVVAYTILILRWNSYYC